MVNLGWHIANSSHCGISSHSGEEVLSQPCTLSTCRHWWRNGALQGTVHLSPSVMSVHEVNQKSWLYCWWSCKEVWATAREMLPCSLKTIVHPSYCWHGTHIIPYSLKTTVPPFYCWYGPWVNLYFSEHLSICSTVGMTFGLCCGLNKCAPEVGMVHRLMTLWCLEGSATLRMWVQVGKLAIMSNPRLFHLPLSDSEIKQSCSVMYFWHDFFLS